VCKGGNPYIFKDIRGGESKREKRGGLEKNGSGSTEIIRKKEGECGKCREEGITESVGRPNWETWGGGPKVPEKPSITGA